MIYDDYFTKSDAGAAFCLVLFYAIYPVISVNINTYCLLVLNQFLAVKSPLRFSTRGNKQKVMIKCAIAGIWLVALAYLGIYFAIIYTRIGENSSIFVMLQSRLNIDLHHLVFNLIIWI